MFLSSRKTHTIFLKDTYKVLKTGRLENSKLLHQTRMAVEIQKVLSATTKKHLLHLQGVILLVEFVTKRASV